MNPFENNSSRSHIVSASCDILDERVIRRGVEFHYNSPMRCAVSFDKLPSAVFLDGQETSLRVENQEQNYGILLPPGAHGVRVLLQSTISNGIELASSWSSAFIVIFGFLAGGLLIGLYIFVKVR